MARRSLNTVRKGFLQSLNDSRQLAIDAYNWSLLTSGARSPLISRKRRDSLTELAFFRAFLAWEAFLEESFILYLIGQLPPCGRAPQRYAFPPNQQAAIDWVIPEGRPFAEWTDTGRVRSRAERFFKAGRPFASVLTNNQHTLEDARILRNAIAHASSNAHQKFEQLVRIKLGVFPANLTVGGFLGMTVPASTPPSSFLEFYFSKIEFAAKQIVRA
jgi:hypothetical protein